MDDTGVDDDGVDDDTGSAVAVTTGTVAPTAVADIDGKGAARRGRGDDRCPIAADDIDGSGADMVGGGIDTEGSGVEKRLVSGLPSDAPRPLIALVDTGADAGGKCAGTAGDDDAFDPGVMCGPVVTALEDALCKRAAVAVTFAVSAEVAAAVVTSEVGAVCWAGIGGRACEAGACEKAAIACDSELGTAVPAPPPALLGRDVRSRLSAIHHALGLVTCGQRSEYMHGSGVNIGLKLL